MPYSADLRGSYFHAELNMAWFYEAMSEDHKDFDFQPTYFDTNDETEEDAIQTTIKHFEKHIEDAFNDYMVYKVFGHTSGKYQYEVQGHDVYSSVWEFLSDVADDYSQNHPEVEITHTSDDE